MHKSIRVLITLLFVLLGTTLHSQSAEELLKQGNSYWEQENYTQAALSWHKAAEQGVAEAQYKLGRCYRNGRGVTQSYTEAAKWFRKAAEQGYTKAQYNLGACYAKGDGVAQSYNEAVKWYRMAAEQETLKHNATLACVMLKVMASLSPITKLQNGTAWPLNKEMHMHN